MTLLFVEGRGIGFPMNALLFRKEGSFNYATLVSIMVMLLKVFTYQVGQALQGSKCELDFFHFSG
ncbi:hypothetical protein [Paenibacillus xylanilyticus]|uniref:hypothetical protein n=1 Tax=Paenibacillus xylanilyticus TaxID=248903 RepID=UPI0039A2CD64